MSTPPSPTLDSELHRPPPLAGIGRMIAFITLAYGLSWASFLAYIVPNWGQFSIEEATPAILIGQFGPTLSALILTAHERGWDGVRLLLHRLLIVRFPLRWWAVATWLIGLTLIAAGIVAGTTASLTQTGQWLAGTWMIILLPLFGPLTAVFGAGPLGEELGWRGYLLPRLVDRYSVSVSSVMLGLIWAFWHLPLFVIAEWRNRLDLPLFVLLYPLSLILLSYGMYFLWKNTRGSVLMAIVFHGSLNVAAANLLPDFVHPVVAYLGAIAGMGLWALLARRLDDRSLPPNPYASPPDVTTLGSEMPTDR